MKITKELVLKSSFVNYGAFHNILFHYQWNYQKSEFKEHFSHSRLAHVSTGDAETGKKSGQHFIGPGNRNRQASLQSWHTSKHHFSLLLEPLYPELCCPTEMLTALGTHLRHYLSTSQDGTVNSIWKYHCVLI